ncbi:MAG: hypothetical protein OXB89_10925 [Anaerolineaceae bacterium]|nr:hypothetical protein [Anaerolineaceae bacterium]
MANGSAWPLWHLLSLVLLALLLLLLSRLLWHEIFDVLTGYATGEESDDVGTG